MRPARYACFAWLLVQLVVAVPASADDTHPLRPLDTSSPRATLQGFSATLDTVYESFAGLIAEYAVSDRLYIDPDRRRKQFATLAQGQRAIQYLDLSKLPPVLHDVAGESGILLKEVLDRVEIPPFEEIPDQAAMARAGTKRWRLPNTEIDIVRIEEGPRAGEYLFSGETLMRVSEFYNRVRHLPYKPGPSKDMNDAYRLISGNPTFTNYDAYSTSPIGLSLIVPPRWMLNLPGWAKARIAELAVWQWFAFAIGLAICLAIVFGSYRLARWLAARREGDSGPGLHSLLIPLAIIFVTAALLPIIVALLRIGAIPRIVIELCRIAALYLAASWLALVGGGVLGQVIVASERLSARSLDSQLIKLGARFLGIVVAIGLLMQAATELGFPAYSVVAGLGVGGLAVALAARDSLANLLGSILIMFEKPFRVGHRIRVGGSEGTVEDVGFRSTRIRTPDNSLISIPNNTVVNATVENLTLRKMFRQRLVLGVTYDTPRETLVAFAARIKELLDEYETVDNDTIRVRFNDFGESSLNILVVFNLVVANAAEELEHREAVLLRIMEVAEELGVGFAFPTRTLHLETMPAEAKLGAAEIGASRPAEQRQIGLVEARQAQSGK